MTRKRFLITSALPYANGSLHFGHLAGAYLPADVYARFQRLQGHEVLYLCASDEHGVAITLSAGIASRSPQEQIDHFHTINRKLFETLSFSFDHYSRTSHAQHAKNSQEWFTKLLEKGFIEEKECEELYSDIEKRFFADRYVKGSCPQCHFKEARGDECPRCGASYEARELGSPRSTLSGHPLSLKKTKHHFFLFDRCRKELHRFFEDRSWKNNVKAFAKEYIDKLRPRAISRDLNWGIPLPLPDKEGKVLYVWFEAPIAYLSTTKEWAEEQGDPNLWKQYWCDPSTRFVQFIGKDNIPFHALFFPAMTMAFDSSLKLVDDLPANEFLLLEGKQFSKSDGWTIDLEDFFTHYSSDQIRYTLCANAPEHSDAEFTWLDFQVRCNTELLGKFGNFAHRCLVFLQKQGGILSPGNLDSSFVKKIEKLEKEYIKNLESFSLRLATQTLMRMAQEGNHYFDHQKPWTLKKEEQKEDLYTILRSCLFCLKTLALCSSPIIPQSAQKLWELLAYEDSLSSLHWEEVMQRSLVYGKKLPFPKALFRKIEDEEMKKEKEKLKSSLPKS